MKRNCTKVLVLALITLLFGQKIEGIGARPEAGGNVNRSNINRGDVNRGAVHPQYPTARPRTPIGGGYATPSMSRADVRPGEYAGQHSASQQPLQGGHPSQNQVQQFMQQRPGQAQTHPTLSPAQQQNIKNAIPQQSQANTQAATAANGQFKQQHPNATNWFNSDFNGQHNYHPNYGTPYGSWGGAGWGGAAAWMGLGGAYGGAYPAVYYDDGDSPVNLTAKEADNYSPPPSTTIQQNFYGAPPPDAQASANAPGAPDAPPQEQGDWLSLGVFAVGSSAEEAPYSNMVVQLALKKDGEIAGTYYNAGTDQTYGIEGMVDKNTQQAVFKLSDNPESPVMTTGLYNLTQNVAKAKVHFPDGTDQAKVLVRLQQ